MTWVYDEFASWILSLLGTTFDVIAKAFLGAFSLDTTMFHAYLPITEEFEPIVKSCAIGLSIAIFMVCCIKNLFVSVSGSYEEPVRLAGLFILSLFVSYHAEELIALEFDFFSSFYKNILSMKVFEGVTEEGLFSNLLMLMNAFFEPIGTPLVIIKLIMTIAIAINFFKLLIATAEKYVVINLLMTFSPLSASTITSKETDRIFWSYIKLGACSLLLMCLHVFFIRGTVSMMVNIGPQTVLYDNADGVKEGSLLIWMFFLLGFMKVGQSLDSYARSLGLDVAQSARSLGDEVTGTARSMMFYTMMAGRAGGFISRMHGGPAGSPGANAAAVNKADKNLASFAAKGSPLNADTMFHGVKGGLSASGDTAKAAMNAVAPTMKDIPGMENAAVSVGKGKMAFNLGAGRSGELSMTPPTNGKPYMTVPTANGQQMYLSSTGKNPLLADIPAKGVSAGFDETFGDKAGAIGQSIGLSEEQLSSTTVTGIGNNCMAVTDENGQLLGTMIANGADTNLATGMGIELNDATMPDAGMIDDYRFVSTPNSGLTDSDYVDAMISDSAGNHYDSQSIVETLNDGRAEDNCVIDTNMAGDSLIATYADGTTTALSSEQLSDYKLKNTDGYTEAHGISDYLSQDAIYQIRDKFYAGLGENANITGYEYNAGNSYATIHMSDGQDFRIYSGSEYSVNGSGSHVVDFAGTQGYAVKMNPKTKTPFNVEVHHRSTEDKKR